MTPPRFTCGLKKNRLRKFETVRLVVAIEVVGTEPVSAEPVTPPNWPVVRVPKRISRTG